MPVHEQAVLLPALRLIVRLKFDRDNLLTPFCLGHHLLFHFYPDFWMVKADQARLFPKLK